MVYVIGDVHGELDTLKSLISRLKDPTRIIFVGDLIDRGKDSAGVISFIRDNGYECVLGNHEEMMLDIANYPLKNIGLTLNKIKMHNGLWLVNGGEATLKSYLCLLNCSERLESDLEWIKTLPVFIDTKAKINGLPVIVSHSYIGEIWPNIDHINFKNIALWGMCKASATSEIFNIHGHTPHRLPEFSQTHANIDSHAFFGNYLSAFCIERELIVSEPAAPAQPNELPIYTYLTGLRGVLLNDIKKLKCYERCQQEIHDLNTEISSDGEAVVHLYDWQKFCDIYEKRTGKEIE